MIKILDSYSFLFLYFFDLVPTTDISKVFTIIYTFLSIGSFVSFTAKTVTIVSDNYKKKREKINKLRLKNEDE